MQNDRHNHFAPGRPAAHHHERPQLGRQVPGDVPRAQDHWRVDLAQDWELAFWSREFGCNENELRKAVQAVGANAGRVRAYFASQIQQQASRLS